jgi:hypothetical protein
LGSQSAGRDIPGRKCACSGKFAKQREYDHDRQKTAVFGIYHTREQAERSADDLMDAGFSRDDISFPVPDSHSTKAFAHEGEIKEGSVLLSVRCDSSGEITRAKDLLYQTGAQDISSSAEGGADFKGTSTVAAHQ